MEQNPSSETNTFSVRQEISQILRDQNFCRRANNSPTVFPIMGKINLNHIFAKLHFRIYLIQTNSCTLFKTHSHSHLKH